ncbi:MAG: hypothetical protein AAGI03_06230 [Pseudomonadota bacterium]
MSVARQIRGLRFGWPKRPGFPFVFRLVFGLTAWFWIPGLVLAGVLHFGTPAVLWTYHHSRGDRSHHLSCTWLSIQGQVRDAPQAGRCAAIRLVPINWVRWHWPDFWA